MIFLLTKKNTHKNYFQLFRNSIQFFYLFIFLNNELIKNKIRNDEPNGKRLAMMIMIIKEKCNHIKKEHKEEKYIYYIYIYKYIYFMSL